MNPSEIDLPKLLKRLHLPTIARLLPQMEQQALEEGLGIRDCLAMLCAEEVSNRNNTRIQKAIRKANFPFLKAIEEFDFTFGCGIKRDQLSPYLGPEFVTEGRNLIFSGKPGRGKTALAIAFGYRAIQNGYSALFMTAAALIEDLVTASRGGRLSQATSVYIEPDVLIIDEIGYLQCSNNAANVLYGVVNGRHIAKKPMVFTTNKPLDEWGSVLHDNDLAEALIDRVLERGRLLTLSGTSYRTRHIPPETLTPKNEPIPTEVTQISKPKDSKKIQSRNAKNS